MNWHLGVALLLMGLSVCHAYVTLKAWRRGDDLLAAFGAVMFIAVIAAALGFGYGWLALGVALTILAVLAMCGVVAFYDQIESG